MRIFGTLLTLVTVSIAQYRSVSNANKIQQFDCYDRRDGNFAVGECTKDYVQCVSGLAYPAECPENLVYVDSKGRCDFLSVCRGIDSTEGVSELSTAAAHSAPVDVYETSNGYHDYDRHIDLIDCSTLLDGSYSHGCTPYYTICSFGVSSQVDCPSGLLFHQPSGRCEWPSLCLSLEVSKPAAIVQSVTAPSTVSETLNESSVTTTAPSSSASNSKRTCVGFEVSPYGDCSSKFKRCRNGIWTGALCPGATVFDASLGLCVYDLPLCKTAMFNPAVPTDPSVDALSSSYNEIEQSLVPYGGQDTVVPHSAGLLDTRFVAPGGDYLSNPFFALRHKNRRHRKNRKHHSDSDHEEESKNTGKLRYSSRSTRINDGSHHVADGLDGKAEHYIHQSYQPTFPRSYKHSHASLKHVWQSMGDESNTKEFEEPLLVVDSAEKALSTEVEEQDLEEGSGISPDDEITRKRRSYSFGLTESPEVNICFNEQDGAFVSMGSCRQDFIFCPKSGTQVRAACAVGDLFDRALKLCVLQENCEGKVELDVTPFSDSTTGASAKNPSADRIVAADPCEGRVDGPLAVGCSVSFVVCKNNVGLEMTCPEGLVFDEGRGICDHRGNVAICGGTTGGSPFVESSRPIALPYYWDDLGSKPTPYKPVVVASSTMRSLPTEYATASSSPNAYRPVFSTPRVPSPYAASTLLPSDLVLPSGVATTISTIVANENDLCSKLPIGYQQIGSCSNSFVFCSGGYHKAVMKACPDNLVYSAESRQCEKKEKVGGCSEYIPASEASMQPAAHSRPAYSTKAPSQPVYTTTESYTTSKPRILNVYASVESFTEMASTRQYPIRYDAYSTSVEPSTTVEPNDIVVSYSSTEQVIVPVECSSEPTPFGKCDRRYTVCSNGVDYVMNCGHTLVFDSVNKVCDLSDFVSECSEAKKPAVTSVYGESTEIATKGELQCDSNVDSPQFAIGFCLSRYAICSSQDVVSYADCTLGHLFDGARGECVAVSECGRAVYGKQAEVSTSLASITLDPRCVGKKDNSLFAERECSSTYLHCSEGVVSTKNCRKHEVFSDLKGRCLPKLFVRACSKRDVQYITSSSAPESFCKNRVDGLYKNPADCTSILQCFGGDIFKAPGCASGLVFNEQTKQCDYRQNVPGCDVAQDPKFDSGCRGFEHGAHIADEQDCTIFYRCVWNRLEKMHCPERTVFNPFLSVCDWISNVPSCKNNAPLINSYY